jgi:glycosyltransferase involved in cell wall biosynthesis
MKQSLKPAEVVLITKRESAKKVRKVCNSFDLNCVVLSQNEGFVTRAYNMGIDEASGDIVLFTDDDAIPPRCWVENYLKFHSIFSNMACIVSRDRHVSIEKRVPIKMPGDGFRYELYRWLIRTWYDSPHPALTKYRLGVYITKRFKVAHGPFYPSRLCYSLPFRGVNMSFKKGAIKELRLPENNLIKRGLGFEEHLGLQLVAKNYESIYVPTNPVWHIAHPSLSRMRHRKDDLIEIAEMKRAYINLLAGMKKE